MTKESIIENGTITHGSPILATCQYRQDYITLDEVKATIGAAMGEYAKRQVIAFDEWKADNKWVQSLHNNYFTKEYPRQHKTSEQLYNQFIEQQNK